MLSEEIISIGERQYRYIGRPRSFHSFAELGQLLPTLSNPENLKRKFLDGAWIFELRKKRKRQLEETAEALGYRLKLHGQVMQGL